MIITHAGFDDMLQQWVLWAETEGGEHWCIPTDQATAERLLAETKETGVVELG